MLVENLGAILLISQDAARLADFYRNALDFPMVDEVHDGVPLHFACEIGSVHFAIHPAETWPGEAHENAQSPVIVFNTADAGAVFENLKKLGIAATPPFDHGFAIIVSFRDPDGNNIQAMQLNAT